MNFKTLVLATSFVAVSSLALAQAPIGSSADFGNGAVVNRGPVNTVGEDLDFRTDRSGWNTYPRRAYIAKHRRGHVASRWH